MAENITSGSFLCFTFLFLGILPGEEWMNKRTRPKISITTQAQYTVDKSKEVRNQKRKETETKEGEKRENIIL